MSNNIIARGKRRQSFEKIWEEVTRTECGLNALSKDERRILECFLSLPGRVL